ncbi:MAG TPA: hypothetical protein VGI63_05955 [Verrucomicrobiae bacterium]|jgi:hypothetical protein
MRCYLCGDTNSITPDHVPPKGFFPEPRPSNLITVPCCAKCNNGFSKDDEAVRAWFSAILGATSAGEWILKNKVTPGIMTRSPAFRETWLNSMQDTKLLSEEDGVIDAVSFKIDPDRVERFVFRIVKGLLCFYYPDYDYSQDTFVSRLILPTRDNLNRLDTFKNSLRYDFRGDGVIQYRFGLTDTRQSGLWIIVFYGATLFFVCHTKNPQLIANL